LSRGESSGQRLARVESTTTLSVVWSIGRGGMVRIKVKNAATTVTNLYAHIRLTTLSMLVAIVVFASPPSARAIDLLNDNITFSPFNLEVRKYVNMPAGSNNIISMTTRSGDSRLYVTTQEGKIYVINQRANGVGLSTVWFDMATTGVSLDGFSGQLGLQSTAFHPDFDKPETPGYGKFYTTMMRSHPDDTSNLFYLGDTPHGTGAPDSVLTEWTFNHDTGQVDPNSYRELYRVNLPVSDHQIKQARFNPYAKPGDDDYGLLYVTHGDSNVQHSPDAYPQRPGNALGKMLRIDPLQAGTDPYTIPATNPFVDTPRPDVLKEIYAFGFRNPHNFSFNPDDQGNVRILVGDIGRANIEEVNLVVPGGNYGWPLREGTFVSSQNPDNTPNSGYYDGVSAIPANEANLNLDYIYPVAQFDHNNNTDSTPINTPYAGMAISSGFVIQNGSDPNLDGQLIFANLAFSDGNVYQASFDEMLGAKISLEPGDLPSSLSQAELHRLRLALDHDNNPDTAPQIHDDFMSLINNFGRTDTRFGEGVFGEMYISSKTNGVIYLVTNSVPLLGDYNKNHVVDAADYVVWRNSLGETGYHLAADGNGNGVVDGADYEVWKTNFGEVWTGSGSGLGASNDNYLQTVPEPTLLALICGVSLALVASGRQFCRQSIVARLPSR